uniref:Secreted protein n=1 Tax=Meloidogyne incognita TaxID=6306 RepID=A0A914LH60_MELIC
MLEGSSLTTLLLMEWLLLLPFAFSFCVCIVTCGGQKKQQPPPGKQQKPPTLQSPSNPPKRTHSCLCCQWTQCSLLCLYCHVWRAKEATTTTTWKTANYFAISIKSSKT